MSRSSKKGPYVDQRLVKKLEKGMGQKRIQLKHGQGLVKSHQNL